MVDDDEMVVDCSTREVIGFDRQSAFFYINTGKRRICTDAYGLCRKNHQQLPNIHESLRYFVPIAFVSARMNNGDESCMAGVCQVLIERSAPPLFLSCFCRHGVDHDKTCTNRVIKYTVKKGERMDEL